MKGSYHFLGTDESFVPWIFLVRSSSEDLLRIPVKKAIRSGNKKPLSGFVRFPAVILPGWLFYVNKTAYRFTSSTLFMKSSAP